MMSGMRAGMGPSDLQKGELRMDSAATMKSKLKKSAFSHLSCSIPRVSKPIFHIGTLRPFFSDLLTLSNAKLKFIIGGAKIPCQKCDMRAQPVLDVR